MARNGTRGPATVKRSPDICEPTRRHPDDSSPGAAPESCFHPLSREQHAIQYSSDFSSRKLRGFLPSDHHNVQLPIQATAIPSKPLSHATFDPVPGYGIADTPAHGDSEPLALQRLYLLCFCEQHHEITRYDPLSDPRNSLKISRAQESICSREAAAPNKHCYFEGVETASRLRPFARRRFKIARPPRELILRRKPWFRLRRIRLG